MSKRGLLAIVCGGVAVIALLTILYAGNGGYRPRKVTIHDSALTVKRFIVSEGTNHTACVGNTWLGRLNRELMGRGRSPIGTARQLTFTTPQESTTLWIQLTHTNASFFLSTQFAGLLRKDGIDTLLVWSSLIDCNSGMTGWSFPSPLTNYADFEFRLVTVPDGKELVTLQF